MYCEKCGVEMKVTDKFCDKCGNKNMNVTNNVTSNVNPSPIVTPPTMNKLKFNLKKLIILVAIIVVIVIGLGVIGALFGDDTSISTSATNNEYINIVKNASPARFPNATYGEAFDNYLANIKWEHIVTDNNENVVEFTGKITYDGSIVDVLIQYDIYDDNTIEFQYYEIIDNGVECSEDVILLSLYYNAFEDVYNNNGYAIPSNITNFDEYFYGRMIAYEWKYGHADENQVAAEVFYEFFNPIDKSNNTSKINSQSASTTIAVETKPAAELAIEDYVDMALAQYTETEEYEFDPAGAVKADDYWGEDWGEVEDYGEISEYIITRDAGLYSGENTSDLIMTIPAGVKVSVTDDCGNGWYYAIYNNDSGYIEANKLIFFDDYWAGKPTYVTQGAVYPYHGYSGTFSKIYQWWSRSSILYNSSDFEIEEYELEELSPEELWIAKNEIYARHGRMFNNEKLQDYFNSSKCNAWYYPMYRPEYFNEDVLSEVEKYNVKFITDYITNNGLQYP